MIVYQTSPVVTDGGEQEAIVSDPKLQDLLEEALMELKKLNLHASFVTNEIITDSEVESDE